MHVYDRDEARRAIFDYIGYPHAANCASAKDETIQKRACELLDNGKIQGRIAALRASVAEKAEIDAASTLRETGYIARSDFRRLFEENGALKNPKDWPEDIVRARVRFWDKNAALERLFKHFGLYERDNRQQPDPVAEPLRAIDGHAKLKPPAVESSEALPH